MMCGSSNLPSHALRFRSACFRSMARPMEPYLTPSPSIDLTGRIALVTGASRGIGYHVARQMAAAGAHVIAVARTVGGLEELDDEIKAENALTGKGTATLVP